MPKITYDSLQNTVTDSCALTQPLTSPAPELRAPSRRPQQTTNNQQLEPTPTATSQSIAVENLTITNTSVAGNVTIDVTQYQNAVEALDFTAYKDKALSTTLSSTKTLPSVETRLGISSTGENLNAKGILGSLIINSNRVVINAKTHMAMLFGAQGVAIGSPNRVNIDAGESITLAAQESLFLGLPNRGEQYTTKTQSQIGRSKGDPTPDAGYEPLVLGVKLANLLEDFLFVLKSAAGVDAFSPVKFQPTTQAELALLANRIPEILSNYAYVDGISHSSVDETTLKAIKQAQRTTTNIQPPSKLTGALNGIASGNFPGGSLGPGGEGGGGVPGTNGNFDKNNPSQLTGLSTLLPDVADVRGHYLAPQAATAFAQMYRAMLAAGLKPNLTDSYRPYSVQSNGFDWDEYVLTGGSITDTKARKGATRRKKGTRNTAMAFPGTSNHGWGKAIDISPAPVQNWIKKYGVQYGWSWYEGRACNEDWHYTYDPTKTQVYV
jgi:hypothetical protein